MPNSLVKRFRDALAAAGQTDERDDFFITKELGEAAQRDNPALFEEFPDFAEEFRSIREANAPSLIGEGTRAFKSGTQGLFSTLDESVALGAKVVGLDKVSDFYKKRAGELSQLAGESAPTIPTLEDVAPGEPSTLRRILSRDALRYGIAKAGQVAPSIAESIGTSAIGAAAGTAAAPGAGTIAGGVTGLVEKSLVKAAMRKLLAKGEALTAENIAKEAAAIGAFRGGVAANALGSVVLNTGDVASEGANTGTTIGLGLISAIPDTILPAYVLGKLFPGVAKKEAIEAGKSFLARNAKKIAELVGVPAEEFGQEYFQEAINVVARNVKDGKEPLTFDAQDLKRLREAGIAGAAGGLLAAPGVALANGEPVAPTGKPMVDPLAARRAAAMAARLDSEQAAMTPAGENTPASVPIMPAGAIRKPPTTEELNAEIPPPPAPPIVPAVPVAPGAPPPTPKIPQQFFPSARESETVAPPPEDPKLAQVKAAISVPGITFQYTVFPLDMAPAGAERTQIDVIGPDGQNLTSSNLDQLAALGVVLPRVPESLPMGKYTPEQVEAAKAPPAALAPAQPSLSGPTASDVEKIGELDTPPAPVSTPAVEPPAPEALSPPAPDAVAQPTPAIPVASAAQVEAQKPKPSTKLLDKVDAAVGAPVPVGPAVDTKLEDRLREELNRPTPVAFGSIQSVDTAVPATLDEISTKGAIGESGNKSATRLAAILESPTGEIVMVGLLPRQQIASTAGERTFGLGVQRFGSKEGGAHSIKEGGKTPALLSEVAAIGYKYLGKVAFDPKTQPGEIFQRWANKEVFAAALKHAQEVKQDNPQFRAIEAEAEALANEYPEADPARQAEIQDELNTLAEDYKKLGGDPKFMVEMPTPDAPQPLPIESNHAQQLAAAAAGIKQFGGNVDLLTRTLLQSTVADELTQRMDALQAQYAGASPEVQKLIQPRIERLQAQLEAVAQVRGVQFTPWHIAVGMDNVQHANLNDLVALLHETGHAILGRANPQMRDRVIRAVNGAMNEITAKLEAARSKTGVREQIAGDPEELIVSTVAQRLAAEGVPDAPSLARAIFQWVKDLYYRVAMGVQAAFGREPSGQLALDWFENQLSRVVGGDYDYRFANLFDRFAPEPMQQQAARFTGTGGTPGGVSDFFNPLAGAIQQPTALEESADALAWNLRFMTEADGTGKELDIPDVEARARIEAAAVNELSEVFDALYEEANPVVEGKDRMSKEDFWLIVGTGEMPAARLAALDESSRTARIAGDRMTEPMNGLARQRAKLLLKSALTGVAKKDASKTEAGDAALASLTEQAKRVKKLEGDLRNADMHEATLRDSLKEMIAALTKGVRRGLDTAFAAGELAQSVREVEGLSERDPIPAEYQKVFRAVQRDEISIFAYMEAIAKLDLPLHEMTRAEIRTAIEDEATGSPELARLLEQKNKPLFVALTALAKKNAAQMDLIQMRAIKGPAAYLAKKAELDEIRQASPAQLRELTKKISEGRKAATFMDRIKQRAIKQREKLRRLQDTIKEVDATLPLLAQTRAALEAKVEEIETTGLPVASEWKPYNGATYLAMRQDEDGLWSSVERPLEFTPEGPARDPKQLLGDLVQNAAYLKDKADKKGTKIYQLVAKQTQELNMIDAQAKTAALKQTWFDKFANLLLPTQRLIAAGGGQSAALVTQMMNRFGFLTGQKLRSDFEVGSARWSAALERVVKASGMKDTREFLDQVREPVVYWIQVNPGRDEGPALREAVKMAKARLTTDPTKDFDDALKDFLRHDKTMGAKFMTFGHENGAYVQDDKLGELRPALDRGWLTLPRSMAAKTVTTVLRDMEAAGWKIRFKDDQGNVAVKKFDNGTRGNERVAGAASFYDLYLNPDSAEGDPANDAKREVLENPDAFAAAIKGFFPPGIVERWLKPFIYKPGVPVFYHGPEAIEPLDVQRAWEQAGGDVGRWIDLLGERVGLEQEVETDEDGATLELGDASLEAQWRVEMLKKLDRLFEMESRIAADSNQVKGLFDANSRPPHLIMDARENDLLPPEHVVHASFDPQGVRNMLATLSFHASFGRNGEAMNRARADIQSGFAARIAAFQDISRLTNNKESRKRMAEDRGYKWAELQQAASQARVVEQGIAALNAQFGFNASATTMQDVRGGLALIHFIAAQATNNPKTGLLNFLQPAQRAMARGSIGGSVVADTGRAYSEVVRNFLGSTFQALGLNIMHGAEHSREFAATLGLGMQELPMSIVMSSAKAGPRGEQLPIATELMRKASAAQRNFKISPAKTDEFAPLQIIPVLQNVMHGMGVNAAISNATAETRRVEMILDGAAAHYASHPDHFADPTYRLTAADVGMGDQASFDYFRRKLVEYNVGTLETLARQAMEKRTRGEAILEPEQAMRVAQLSANEVDLAGGINTNPAAWDTNQALKYFTPLLGWPIRQMNSVHAAMRIAEGRYTFTQAAKVAGIMAAWMLPIGLAFTFLTDEYDDKILKKKTNLGRVDPLAIIPGIGAPLALATSDIPANEQLIAMFQRLSRAGNIYGLGMDYATQLLAGTDPTSGARPFTADGRVLVFSQLHNFTDAISNWYNSGFATTYANFERPLISSLVGSGPLQALDILGNALGLDNQEMRINQRTNVQQWLRAAGREAGVELRRSGGGSVAPTPSSVWTREMWLAALGNDRLDFQEAYRRAVDAAREAGADDPEAKVLESWRSRDPLEVFRNKPDAQTIGRMISIMSPNGKEAVQSALRLYDQYTTLIEPTKAERAQKRALGAITRQPDPNSLRRQMANSLLVR